VIFEIKTGKIDAIAGVALKPTGRFNSVESRLDVVLPRLNDDYSATDVPSGRFAKGDILPVENRFHGAAEL
jgi:hypothetical protein